MKINIGKDFSNVPQGRYHPKDGEFTGEKFRETVLKDIAVNPDNHQLPIVIILDDAEGYGSSFLDEAFGGLVRKGYVTNEEALKLFSFVFSDPDFEFYKTRIESYIKDAEYGVEK